MRNSSNIYSIFLENIVFLIDDSQMFCYFECVLEYKNTGMLYLYRYGPNVAAIIKLMLNILF